MSDIVALIEEKLPMQLDSISWNKKYDLLAIGAYMIDPTDSTKRIGTIFLIQLKLENADQKDSTEASTFELIEKTSVSGVLDLRWEPNQQEKLAVATSDSFELYELKEMSHFQLHLINRIKLDSMALYTQWMDSSKLIYSDSEGVINVVTTDPWEIISSQKVHDNLTWVVQFSPKSNLVFAGSDEGKFTGFLLDYINDEEKHYTKKFQVGVTSILFLTDTILAVGSYDDTLRLFSIDCMDPIILSLKRKIEFGGAVWRTLAFPVVPLSSTGTETYNYHVVAACARNGVHWINLNCKTWSYETITTCLEYKGFLAYGIDVKFICNEKSRSYIVSSCYFDNHQLHVWKVDLPLPEIV